MADEADDKAAWTIKSVNVEVRKMAVASATREGQTMAEWIDPAIRQRVTLLSGERVIPPRSTANLPALLAPAADMAPIADMLRAAQEVARAADVPIPKATARHALALATAQLRAARGLPPKRGRIAQGQTIEAAQQENNAQ